MHIFPEDIGTSRFEDDVLAVLGTLSRRRLPANPIAFDGSSSFRFWQSMAADLECADVVNLGFGGGTFRSGQHYFERLLSPLNPGKIVIYFGENDISNDGLNAASTLANMQRLHERIGEALPSARVFFLSSKQSPTKWPYNDVVTDFNSRAREYCADAGAEFIDVTSTLLGEHGRPVGRYYVDNWCISTRSDMRAGPGSCAPIRVCWTAVPEPPDAGTPQLESRQRQVGTQPVDEDRHRRDGKRDGQERGDRRE